MLTLLDLSRDVAREPFPPPGSGPGTLSAACNLWGVFVKLYTPNIALFIISGCLAMLGVLAALPISLPIPGLTANPAWYIFLAWFLLAAGSAIPHQDREESDQK